LSVSWCRFLWIDLDVECGDAVFGLSVDPRVGEHAADARWILSSCHFRRENAPAMIDFDFQIRDVSKRDMLEQRSHFEIFYVIYLCIYLDCISNKALHQNMKVNLLHECH